MLKLASRLDGVSESATLKLNAAVQKMKASGINVVNLTAGEPDFNVPDAAKMAIIAAVETNKSKYTPVPGIPELREAVAKKTNLQQPSLKKPWDAKNVVVCNGGKQAIFNTILALIEPGDEVLIPSPYWLSYPEMVKVAGGVSKFIHAPISQDFKIKPDQLEKAITKKTKMIILNSPSNPTGSMYTKEEFKALGCVLCSEKAQNIWVISDEIYDRIILGKNPFSSFLGAVPELRERTITVNGMSKSAAMTGWRIGWSVADDLVTGALITLQGQSTSGINAPAQWASLAALQLPESDFKSQIDRYRTRRDSALDILKKAAKIELYAPEGAFYIFAGIKGYLSPGEDSMGFAERLLEAQKVAVVPGTPFGEPAFVRLSFATDEKTLEDGCKRIVDFLK